MDLGRGHRRPKELALSSQLGALLNQPHGVVTDPTLPRPNSAGRGNEAHDDLKEPSNDNKMIRG
eukprot:9326107-Alexandrium_andersonii.AAC.1